MMKIELMDGKYTLISENGVGTRCLRYGEEWQDLTGNSMVLALMQEIERLKEDAMSHGLYDKERDDKVRSLQHSRDSVANVLEAIVKEGEIDIYVAEEEGALCVEVSVDAVKHGRTVLDVLGRGRKK